MTKDPHPEFALEALEGMDPSERRELLELLEHVPSAFVVPPGPSAVRARLLEETAREPERYAPFTRRVSELYDISREDARRVLERISDAKSWRASGLPGIKKLAVAAGASRADAQTYLVRFAAGARFPEHHHDGLETVLLLAGSYTEDGGKLYQSGDMHVMEPGTSHSFEISRDEDCIAATLLHGKLNFRSLPLRLLARILGH